MTCPICSQVSSFIGEKRGRRTDRLFRLRRCGNCGFGYVENPWTDYKSIYDDQYYSGNGSDPLVDYAFEYENPTQTIRQYEWIGIERAVAAITPDSKRWLDYGCGNGALVRYLAVRHGAGVFGFDTGTWAKRARNDQLPILDESELDAGAGSFDVITAIEVIEHIIDPIAFLTQLRRLVRPGALLFLTTQNAVNAPKKFVDWPYVQPEIHVSYFTATALGLALKQSGFEPKFTGFVPGWEHIIRFKVLKNLRIRKVGCIEQMIPWSILARWIDRRYQLSALPVGIAR